MLRYSKSGNLMVRNTVLGGAGIVVLGCAATMMVIAVLNMRRTRNIMKGNEDLRGSARWATKADILKRHIAAHDLPTGCIQAASVRETTCIT